MRWSKTVTLVEELTAAGDPLIHHHTSGHASVGDLRRLTQAVNPTTVVPIHTEAPGRYGHALQRHITPHPDGVWWPISTGGPDEQS